MSQLTVYTSRPDGYPAKVFAEYLAVEHQRPVVVRPLSELAPPQPERLASLRLERRQLRQDLVTIDWCLSQYASGQWQPDAGHENGLKADQDALQSRLRAVERTLQAQKGEQVPDA